MKIRELTFLTCLICLSLAIISCDNNSIVDTNKSIPDNNSQFADFKTTLSNSGIKRV